VIAVPASPTAVASAVCFPTKSVEVYVIAVFLTFKASTTRLLSSTFAWAVANKALLSSAAP